MGFLRLGVFFLQERLAVGGSSAVWRGVHPDSSLAVAIKLLRPDGWQDRAALAREARAVASLLHPAVVRIVDYGEVDAATARLRPDDLTPGQPYLVMELAEATLWERPPPPGFAALRSALRTLLGGLAHAHARGVIHCDLKPSNVLWIPGPPGHPPRLALADFGIARLASETSLCTLGGTPGYMAPEQVSESPDVGPWTDLFALGTLARELAYAPGGAPRFPLPDGFAAWIDRMTAFAFTHRFASAAEAAYALTRLPDAPEPSSDVRALSWADDAATALAGPDHGSDAITLPDAAPPVPFTPGSARPAPRVHVPTPSDWREPLELGPLHVVGAGLGLHAFRALPLVGRELERDRLWRTLASVVDGGEGPRAIVLRGPAGVGKSYLAQWLAQRADELGLADVIAVTLDEKALSGARMRDGLRAWLRCHASSFREVRARMDAIVPWLTHVDGSAPTPGLVDALARVLASEGVEPAPTAAERRAVIARLLLARARVRPVVLWLEDLPWDDEAIALVRRLVAPGLDGARVLVIATVQNEALPERPAASAALDAWSRDTRVETLEVSPLDPVAHHHLVRDLLGLRADLAQRVADRTTGNPLFAVQLVGHWIARRMLRIDAGGVALAEGSAPQFPDDLHELWQRRVERLTEGAAGERIPLELAAVLGSRFDVQRWKAAAMGMGIPVADALVERLLESHLAVWDGAPGGELRFVHGMIRESLLRSARERGRLQALHSSAADVLQAELDAGDVSVADALARQLWRAGRLEDLPRVEMTAARHAAEQGRLADAGAHLDRVTELRERLALPDMGRLACEEAVVRASYTNRLGELDRAVASATRALELAVGGRYRDLEAEALHELGFAEHHRGRSDDALARLDAAVRAWMEVGATRRLARCLRVRGDLLHSHGRFAEARADFARALDLSERDGDRAGVASSYLGLALPGVDESPEHAQRALAIFEEIGHASGACTAVNTLAERARREGRLEEAEALYREARGWAQLAGASQHEHICALNLALTLLQRERWEEALVETELGARMAGLLGQRLVAQMHEVVAMSAAAGAGRFAEAMEHAMRALERSAKVDHGDPDIVWAAKLAASHARAAEQHALVDAAIELAAGQLARMEGVSDPEGLEAIRARLRSGE
jgi:tetratricopeptide (TPR) repeat protein